MQQIIEQQLHLPRVSVLLANIEWDAVHCFHPTVPGYYVTQRLSQNHAPLRFESPPFGEAFSSVRSVGIMPPTFALSVSPPERPFRGLSCVFEEDYFESVTGVTPEAWQQHPAEYLALPNERIAALMQQIHLETVRPGFAAELMIESLSKLVLVELARDLQRDTRSTLPGPAAVAGGLAPWQLRRIQERIHAGPALGFPQLGELAAIGGISEGHLMRAFRASTGSTLHQYIARQRMQYARSLLAADTMSIAGIASELGFASAAYFATAFRRYCGVSPSQYRRRARSTRH